VTFLVRAKRAEQLRRDGLQVVSPHGDFALQPKIIQASDLKEPYDVVLVGVKAYSLDDAMSQFASAVGANTMVSADTQRVETCRRSDREVRARRASSADWRTSAPGSTGMVVWFSSWPIRTIVFGEIKGPLSEALRSRLEKLLKVPGIDVRASRSDHARHVGEVRSAQYARRHHLPDARERRRHFGRA